MINDDLKALLAALKQADTTFQTNPAILNDIDIGTVQQVRDALSYLITATQEATK